MMAAALTVIASALRSWGWQAGFWLMLVLLLHAWGSMLEDSRERERLETTVTQLRLKIADQQTAQVEALAAAHAQARETTRTLKTENARLVTETQNEVRRLSDHRTALLERLQRAEARVIGLTRIARLPAASGQPAGDPAASAPARDDAGGELPGFLGEADVREAERADRIRVSLKACYAQYGLVEHSMGALRAR